VQQVNIYRFFSGTKTKAFTLLELLIVIFIVSLVYILGFEAYSYNSKPKKAVDTPLALKDDIRMRFGLRDGTLICTDACRHCQFRSLDGSYTDTNISLKSKPVVYVPNRNFSYEEAVFGRIDDKRICLQIEFYRSGGTSPLIIEYQNNFYALPSLLQPSKTFSSFSEAEHYMNEAEKLMHQEGNYY